MMSKKLRFLFLLTFIQICELYGSATYEVGTRMKEKKFPGGEVGGKKRKGKTKSIFLLFLDFEM